MSKKKNKNSNYKTNFGVANDATAKDKKKNRMIAIVCAVIVRGALSESLCICFT